LGPYIILFLTAFSRNWVLGPTLDNLTLSNYVAVVADEFNRRAVLNSLLFSVAAATLGLALGAGLAAVIVRGRSGKVHRSLDLLVTAAWAFPSIGLGAAYLITSVQPPVLYGTSAILILAYTTKFMPLATRAVVAGLQQLGPEVEEAARIAGAGALGTTRRILMPLLAGWLLSAWILMFAPSIHELSASVLLSGPGRETFALAALLAFESSKFELAAALGAVGVLMTCLIWVVVVRLGGRAAGSMFS
jgi:iron(III) transport system permease protein